MEENIARERRFYKAPRPTSFFLSIGHGIQLAERNLNFFPLMRCYTTMAKTGRSGGNPIAWVHTVPEDEAEGLVKKYYEAGRKKFGSAPNISRPFSNRPELMRAHRGLYLTLMHGESGLSRVEREFLAIAVSKANGCFY